MVIIMLEGAILLIPFLGTSIGAFMVFFMKNKISPRLENALLGFASGVMIAASVWSLLLPSIDMALNQGVIAWVPALVGFSLGIMFLLFIDKAVAIISTKNELLSYTGRGFASKTNMMIFAVTIHNIPEGMAVGVACAGALNGNTGISFAGALALSIGIAIQNLPEGAIISMPLKSSGVKKSRAFLYGILSGVVEPIFGAITILLASLIVPLLPYFLSFAAGAMMYVVIKELIPDSQKDDTSIATINTALGFLIMMVLDVALG